MWYVDAYIAYVSSRYLTIAADSNMAIPTIRAIYVTLITSQAGIQDKNQKSNECLMRELGHVDHLMIIRWRQSFTSLSI